MVRPGALLALLLALAATCHACNEGLYLNAADGTCGDVFSCPSGTFPDDSSWTCAACATDCSSCSSADAGNCFSCVDGAFRDTATGTCGATCPPAKYGNTATKECEQCHWSCTGCTSPAANACTACFVGEYLNSVTHTCGGPANCHSGTFADTNSVTCEACATDCSACTSAGVGACIACNDGAFLDTATGTCGATCPDGTYGDAGSKVCQACNGGCATCSRTANNCESCAWGTFLSFDGSSGTLTGVCGDPG
ncbi:hypothetical protein Rsub_04806 [Raphidocelis subcapitata]|uniref:Tyrosine-protein kinase ephrin type A/B receptor-like domain-containing protein n=1 Tax=Raphidocelis subcapitata TaxID=307507 RepID=A0A2V0P1R8_9CHLO|nr:hypothetical protein Rsub_04806 [Raphidocelis subcapitata]|eukprot:GBF91137.1 hypothetical protein Rsub_04806 [Raphidocelis subcapitata]